MRRLARRRTGAIILPLESQEALVITCLWAPDRLRRPMMQPTTNVPWARRELLRQRLHQLVATRDATDLDSIARQIDDLLEEAFDEDELIAQPAPAWSDDRREDDRIVVTGMGLVTPLGIGIDLFERAGRGPQRRAPDHPLRPRRSAQPHRGRGARFRPTRLYWKSKRPGASRGPASLPWPPRAWR